MALSATVAWEHRPTNGTANAGGGFNASGSSPGTDYSQQNGVQVAFDGVTISGANSGVSANVVITGYAAAATDNRNLVAITGGTNFVTGIYEIVSVTAGVSGVGSWTLDRNCTTGVGAGMTGNMGGARSGMSGGTTTMQASVVAGNKIWTKNEAWNEAVASSVNGGTTTPIIWEGYNTARGDAPVTDATMPTNDRAAGAGTFSNITGSDWVVKNIRGRRSTAAGFTIGAARQTYYFCKSDTNATVGFSGGNNAATYIGCESRANTTIGFGTTAGIFTGCGSHNNTTNGWSCNTNQVSIVNSLSYANAATGILDIGGNSLLQNNTVYGNTGASTDGFGDNGNVRNGMVINNIFSTNGRYGVNTTAGSELQGNWNDYNGNTTAARNNFPAGPNDSTADPTFTNAGSGDFSIGTNLKALGWPGAFPGAVSTGYLDMGAVQRQEPAGSLTAPVARALHNAIGIR